MEALCDDLGIPFLELVIDVVIMDCERLQRLRQQAFPLLPGDIRLWEQHLPVHVELFEDFQSLEGRFCECIPEEGKFRMISTG